MPITSEQELFQTLDLIPEAKAINYLHCLSSYDSTETDIKLALIGIKVESRPDITSELKQFYLQQKIEDNSYEWTEKLANYAKEKNISR